MSGETNNSPIAVFDSGLGGLTVLKELKAALPGESFIYLGDTARLPYGTKSQRTIYNYLQKGLGFFNTKKAKAVVVACNSASSVFVGAHDIQSEVPLYNVIEPGALKAAKTTGNGQIGILATKTTVYQGAYVHCLQQLNPRFKIIQQPCPLLVPLVEEGWEEDPLTNLVLYRYINPIVQMGIDTLILGCTHYPILKEGISKVVGPHVQLVDSALTLADELEKDLASGKIQESNQSQATIELFTTDEPKDFHNLAVRLMPEVEELDVQIVDL